MCRSCCCEPKFPFKPCCIFRAAAAMHCCSVLQDALEWALYVQELLLWQPWPARLLALPGFRESAADANSRLPLFRGPR
jgi:hypothetical protein